MKIAIQGCLHGQLDDVYHHLEQLQYGLNIKIDALIICGDFQSLRDQHDLSDMHCPEKYKQMGTFNSYFHGTKKAPILTIFIGGNHEAVNSLRQSHFGGWMAENIYFLGQVGSIFIQKGQQKIKITGSSGIYNHSDFRYNTRIQQYPLRGKDRIMAYHTKQLDVYRLQLLTRINCMKQSSPQIYGTDDANFDIMLSHDWPKNIALFGDREYLNKIKPYFTKQIQNGTLGSPAMLRILQIAKPSYWFSAHMHVKYPAIYPHQQNKFTHFLSLDKCLGKRSCLQILQFANKSQILKNQQKQQVKISFDPTWMAVLLMTQQMSKGNDHLYYFDKQQLKLSNPSKMNDLIKQYPSFLPVLQNWKGFMLNSKLDQTEQTKQLIKKIGIRLQFLFGICFQGEFRKQVNDEIQLQL